MARNIDLHGNQSEANVLAAIQQADLSYDLESFPHKLQQEVGEAGINLSGGQKQRVSLARAFISKRKFLVLDDPLSGVDPSTERKLFESIMHASRGFLLASHRLDQLSQCDRILVIDDGKVIEDGAPQTLLKDPTSSFSQFMRREEAA